MRASALILFVFGAVPVFSQVAASGPSAPSLPAADKARIEGQVTNLAGEPLKKASLRLQGSTASPASSTDGRPSMPTSYTSQSDAAGNFVFEEVEPGRYMLSAERTGYVRTNYGARSATSPAQPLLLSAGQKMTGIGIKLTPQGLITGRITDEDGDPVTRAQVMVFQPRYVNGRKMMVPAGTAAMTTAEGTFEVSGLAAGRYYLSATDLQSTIVSGQNELPGRKGPQESYVTTYYPNGTELSSAAPIDVTSGSEVRGVEIRLQKARVFRVHGKLVVSSPLTNAVLQLVPQDSGSSGVFFMLGTSLVRADGNFDFQRVLPGTYVIRSQMIRFNDAPGTATPLYTRQPVTVSDSNIDNLEVQPVPGGELTGQITIEGRDPQQQQPQQEAPASRPTVLLSPLQPGAGSSGASTGSENDGSFRIRNIAPDQYRVTVSGLPQGAYVKAIRYGGQDISRTTIDLSSGGGGRLEILLSPDAADLSGVARNAKGEAMAGVTLSLWEPGAANAAPEAIFVRTAIADQNGNFQFRGLPPGEYRVAAWEQSDTYIGDPQFRAKFEGQAATVKLSASGHVNTDVTAIPPEAIEVEAAKLR